jgi:hypothetical protein
MIDHLAEALLEFSQALDLPSQAWAASRRALSACIKRDCSNRDTE